MQNKKFKANSSTQSTYSQSKNNPYKITYNSNKKSKRSVHSWITWQRPTSSRLNACARPTLSCMQLPAYCGIIILLLILNRLILVWLFRLLLICLRWWWLRLRWSNFLINLVYHSVYIVLLRICGIFVVVIGKNSSKRNKSNKALNSFGRCLMSKVKTSPGCMHFWLRMYSHNSPTILLSKLIKNSNNKASLPISKTSECQIQLKPFLASYMIPLFIGHRLDQK